MASTFQDSSPVATLRSPERASSTRPPGSRSGLGVLPVRDADAPTILQLVAVFEDLVERGAGLDDVVRTVALTTECAAGLSGPRGQVLAHCDRHGARLAGGEPTVSVPREAGSDGAVGARLWIERDSPLCPLDELVLAWGARAARLILERMTQVTPAVSPIPDLVELLIDADVSVVERSRACRTLGYESNQSIRVAVAQVPGGAAGKLGEVGRRIQPSGGGRVLTAVFGDVAIFVMCGTVDADATFSGMQGRLGIGPARPAIEAPRSYRGAREALRFAQGPGAGPIAHFDQLGSVVALAAVADTDLMDLQDRVALAELSRTETGLTAILTAEVLMRTGSQREAAARMNLHHSTVAHRVGHVEQALGYGLGEHSNWFRAQLAIHLWRLSWPDPVSTASSAGWRTATAEVPPSA